MARRRIYILEKAWRKTRTQTVRRQDAKEESKERGEAAKKRKKEDEASRNKQAHTPQKTESRDAKNEGRLWTRQDLSIIVQI